MAGRIRKEDVDAVRDRSRVADVIGEHVELRRAGGGSVKGLCPFHDEKSPSFNVTPSRGLWYCFGCAEGGDVIAFVQKIDHLGFTEAVERLADRAGIQLRYEQGTGNAGPFRQPGQRSRLVEVNKAAAAFYAEQLGSPGAAQARQYLAERGFGPEVAATYGCGFAPDSWDAVTNHLRQKGFSHSEVVTAGLSRESQRRRGSYVDFFRRRLLWPIKDLTGDIVGFGARKLFDDDEMGKYLNTAETPVFKKSSQLFGIEKARKEISSRRQVVVVEGYTDVMACHLAGVPTAVATCGTAFTDDHISVVRRLLIDDDVFRGEVVFVFDGDAAGQKAALKAFSGDQRFTAQTFVAVAPDGQDPCELRQSQGDLAVRDLIATRRPLVEFVLASTLARHDLNNVEGRVAGLNETVPLVAQIKDVALRSEYARRLAGMVGVDDPDRVVTQVRAWKPSAAANRPRYRADDEPATQPVEAPPIPRPRPDHPSLWAEREALKLALQVPQLAGTLFDAIDPMAYRHPAYSALRQAIADAGGAVAGATGPEWLETVGEHTTGPGADVVRSVSLELAVEAPRTPTEPDHRYVTSVLAAVQLPGVHARISEVKSKLQRINPVTETESYNRLFGELVSLEAFARALRDQSSGNVA